MKAGGRGSRVERGLGEIVAVRGGVCEWGGVVVVAGGARERRADIKLRENVRRLAGLRVGVRVKEGESAEDIGVLALGRLG